MDVLYLKTNTKKRILSPLLSKTKYDATYFDHAGEDRERIACLESLRQGDTLYIERESFLADSVVEAVSVLSNLAKRGVDVYLERKKKLIKSESSPFKKLNSDLALALVGFRNAFTKLRQLEGYKKAKAEGRIAAPGKRPLPENFEDVKQRWLEKKISIIDAAAECEMPVSTFWSRCKKK